MESSYCTLNNNLRYFFYKILYYWNPTPDNLTKMYKGVSHVCWKNNCREGTFYHIWQNYDKAKKYWRQIYPLIQEILKTNIKLKPEVFFQDYFKIKILEKKWYFINYVDCSKNSVCAKIEGQVNSHKGRIDGKGDGAAERAKVTVLIKECIQFCFHSGDHLWILHLKRGKKIKFWLGVLMISLLLQKQVVFTNYVKVKR